MSAEYFLVCEICNETIAGFFEMDIKYPLTGAMFHSPDPNGEVPAPFHESLAWQYFRCPWCQHLPFIVDFDTYEEATDLNFPKRLRTPDGYFEIEQGMVIGGEPSPVENDGEDRKEVPIPAVDETPKDETAEKYTDETVQQAWAPEKTEEECTEIPSGVISCPYCNQYPFTAQKYLKRHMLHKCKAISEDERKILKDMAKKGSKKNGR